MDASNVSSANNEMIVDAIDATTNDNDGENAPIASTSCGIASISSGEANVSVHF